MPFGHEYSDSESPIKQNATGTWQSIGALAAKLVADAKAAKK